MLVQFWKILMVAYHVQKLYFMDFHHVTMDKLHKVYDSEADVRLGSMIKTLTKVS